MSETLYPYYERELAFIRHIAQDFARQYPNVASRLGLEQDVSTDPHVERLIQAFALVAGRIHHKIDDEFPELTDALLTVLYPHYLAPFPSTAIVEFVLDPARAELPEGFPIPRHSRLHIAQAVRGVKCRYRTAYPVTLWPVALTYAQLLPPPFPADLEPPAGTVAALRMRLECQSALPLSGLKLKTLRFFLRMASDAEAGDLYELLFNHARRVVFRPLDLMNPAAQRPVPRPGFPAGRPTLPQARPFAVKPEDAIRPVGFEADEGLIPYPKQSFAGYRLLTEYFAFPHKFLFFDLGGWERAAQFGFGRQAEVIIFLNRSNAELEKRVDASTFRLGCTPIVNLFEKTAEPIALTHTRNEYRVVPDVGQPHGLEVYSVDQVSSLDGNDGSTKEYQPFYSFRHAGSRDTQRTFWYASRKTAIGENDRGTEVSLNLVNLDYNPRIPEDATLIVRTTCINRDLPNELQRAGDRILFELEMAAPLSRINCIRPPTPTLRPPMRRGAFWKLISHLSLNHLSLTDDKEGRQALREMLSLYDFTPLKTGSGQTMNPIVEGIHAVSSRHVIGRVGWGIASGFARGCEITLTVDDQKFVGSTGMFLFASVLERFFGLYVSINSFTQLVLKIKDREEVVKKFAPRAGERPLI